MSARYYFTKLRHALLVSLFLRVGQAFVVVQQPPASTTPRLQHSRSTSTTTHLYYSTEPADNAGSFNSMKAGEIKQELESKYGISTKSFLEKKELVEALTKARADFLSAMEEFEAANAAAATTDSSTAAAWPAEEEIELESNSDYTDSSTTSSTSSWSTEEEQEEPSNSYDYDDYTSTRSYEEKVHDEIVICQKMHAAELKRELEERGVKTTTMFEKRDFVEALAEARVKDEEGWAVYTNVEVLTDDMDVPFQSSSSQEDFNAEEEQPDYSDYRSYYENHHGQQHQQQQQHQQPDAQHHQQQQQQQPDAQQPYSTSARNPYAQRQSTQRRPPRKSQQQYATSSPYGGDARVNPYNYGQVNPHGQSMGGIADILKNISKNQRSEGDTNPFANYANNSGGTVRTEAARVSASPVVQKILRNAQSDPVIMQKVKECMSNAAALHKYQFDPDVSGLVAELREFIL